VWGKKAGAGCDRMTTWRRHDRTGRTGFAGCRRLLTSGLFQPGLATACRHMGSWRNGEDEYGCGWGLLIYIIRL